DLRLELGDRPAFALRNHGRVEAAGELADLLFQVIRAYLGPAGDVAADRADLGPDLVEGKARGAAAGLEPVDSVGHLGGARWQARKRIVRARPAEEGVDAAGDIVEARLEPAEGVGIAAMRRGVGGAERRLDAARELGDAHFEARDGARGIGRVEGAADGGD